MAIHVNRNVSGLKFAAQIYMLRVSCVIIIISLSKSYMFIGKC